MSDTPAAEDRVPLAPGTLVGRFVLTEPLGIGGFGITYKAEDPVLGRTVAIKELFLDGCQRSGIDVTGGTVFRQTRDRFLSEARLLASLDEHPNLLAVHEVIQANGTVYIAMAYVQGRTSKALLAGSRGGLPELRVLGIMEQVAAALEHVHSCGVLHRDVKPDNVMLAPKPRGWPFEDWVILIDFGAARELLDHSQAMTRVLTPGFAPLEQYAESYRYGAPLDVYGLAATAYYLLTGKVPVNAADRSIVDRLVPLRELRPDISDEMVQGITRGLALRPDERVQTPTGLVDACRSAGSSSREWMSGGAVAPVVSVGSGSAVEPVPATSPTVPVGSASVVEPVPATSPTVPVGPAPVTDVDEVSPSEPPTVQLTPTPTPPVPVPVVESPTVPQPVVELPAPTAPTTPPADTAVATATVERGRSRVLLVGAGVLAAVAAAGGLFALNRGSSDRKRASASDSTVVRTTVAPATNPAVAPDIEITPPEDASDTASLTDDTEAAAETTGLAPVDPVALPGPVGPLTATFSGLGDGAAWGWTPGRLFAASAYTAEPNGNVNDARTFDLISIRPSGAGSQGPTATIVNPGFVLSDTGSGFTDVRWSKNGQSLVTWVEKDDSTDYRSVLQCSLRVYGASGNLRLINPCVWDVDWLDEDHLITVDDSRAAVWSLDGSAKIWPDNIGTSALVRSSANGREVAVVDVNGTVQVFTLGDDLLPVAVRALNGSVGTPTAVRWLGPRNALVVAGSEGAYLWDLDETTPTPDRIDGSARAVGTMPDGSLLAIDDGSTTTVFSLADGEEVARFEHEPFARVTSIEFNATNRLIALNGTAADGSGLRRTQYWHLRPA